MHLLNTVGDFCSDESSACSRLIDFLTQNFKWIKSQISLHQDDPYWHHVNLIFSQFYGLFHGYYNIDFDLNVHENVFDSMLTDIKPYLNLL